MRIRLVAGSYYDNRATTIGITANKFFKKDLIHAVFVAGRNIIGLAEVVCSEIIRITKDPHNNVDYIRVNKSILSSWEVSNLYRELGYSNYADFISNFPEKFTGYLVRWEYRKASHA